MLIYFLSGVCSLVDEVVWVRLLKLILGNTVYATTVVVSVFLGGLALGAMIMSRYADRITDRLRWYALLETVVTVSALSVPWVLSLVDTTYVWFFRRSDSTPSALLVVQVLLSAATILVPSMLMGSTLPLLGRHVTALERETGHLVGKLYALNTLGAATGCFLAGFVLIRALGVWGTLYTAASLNLVVALAAWILRARGGEQPAIAPDPAAAPAAPRSADAGFYLLVGAFFLSGFVSIGYEIGWIRSVMYLLGGGTYVFSSVLTVYLLGNVVGTAIGSRLVPRLSDPARGFAVTLALLGLCGVLYLPGLVLWATQLLAPVERWARSLVEWTPLSPMMLEPLAQSLFLFLPPSLLMGIGFPLALQAWTDRVHGVGRSTGAGYGANTIGAVLGGVVTGFVLIPHLGVQSSVTVLGLAAAWLAGALFWVSARDASPARRLGPAAFAVALSLLALVLPAGLLRHVMEASPWLSETLETVSVREGVTATVTVHRNPVRGTLHLYSSGQSIAGDTYALRGDQKALGHFGVLLNPHARRVLSVGFGSGETTKCLADHGIEQIDCVEIAPEVVSSALEYFGHLNLGPRVHEHVRLIYMDAKNYLHLTDRRYDVIVNDSIHPRNFSENASLYAKEYFESARQRLEGGGLFVSWLPTYHMSPDLFDSILGTLTDVFPHVSLWYLTQNPAPLVVLVASADPQRYLPSAVEQALQRPQVRQSLAVIGIHDAFDLLNCYVGDERDLRNRIPRHTVNSDFTPYVEFNADSWSSPNEMFRHYVLEVRSDRIFEHLDLDDFSAPARERWLAEFRRRRRAADYLLRAYGSTNELEQLKLQREGLALAPGDPALLRDVARAEEALLRKGMRVMDAATTNRAMELADAIQLIHPGSATAWIIRSRVMQRRGEVEAALVAARRAVEVDPQSAPARDNLREMQRAHGEASGLGGGAR